MFLGLGISAGFLVTLHAQENNGYKTNDFTVQFGAVFSGTYEAQLQDLRKLAAESTLLQRDFSTFKRTGYNFNNNTFFSAGLGFVQKKKENSYAINPVYRVGFSYLKQNIIAGEFSEELRFAQDTLRSANSNVVVYLDSVRWKNYQAVFGNEQMRLELAVQFRTNPKLRWSFYTGAALSLGYAINTFTTITYLESNGVSAKQGNANLIPGSNYSNFSSDLERETIQGKNAFSASVSLPLGVDFRIGKKRELWQKAHLLFELRPALNFQQVSGFKNITNTMAINTFGFKYDVF